MLRNPKMKGQKMYAIVETGGKQYQVEEGRYVDIELLEAEQDSKVVFDKVVGASAEGTVVKHDKAKKIIVFKQRPKKGYRKKQGHRQGFTRVMISKIRTSAQKKASDATEDAE